MKAFPSKSVALFPTPGLIFRHAPPQRNALFSVNSGSPDTRHCSPEESPFPTACGVAIADQIPREKTWKDSLAQESSSPSRRRLRFCSLSPTPTCLSSQDPAKREYEFSKKLRRCGASPRQAAAFCLFRRFPSRRSKGLVSCSEEDTPLCICVCVCLCALSCELGGRQVGFLIEDLYGAPQDIEGAVLAGEVIAVVQTRPQV